MHPVALEFIRSNLVLVADNPNVIEIGSRIVNGSLRELLGDELINCASYVGIDLFPGLGVDVVADASHWRPNKPVDVVLCSSVLEHWPIPEGLINAAHEMLKPGGALILTTTADPWEPHSNRDGGLLDEREYYANIKPEQLCQWYADWSTFCILRSNGGDLLSWACK